MALSTYNYFQKYLPYIWGFASICSFSIAANYFKRYQNIVQNNIYYDNNMNIDEETSILLENEGKKVLENVFLGIASGIQTIPEKYIPNKPISRGIIRTSQTLFMIGFFYITLPKTLGDYTNKQLEIDKLTKTYKE